MSLFFKVGKHSVFLKYCGKEFQTMGPKTEKDLFPEVSREKRRIVSREVSRNRSVWKRIVRMKKIITVWWRFVVVTETLKA